jgi:alpha-galactosidase
MNISNGKVIYKTQPSGGKKTLAFKNSAENEDLAVKVWRSEGNDGTRVTVELTVKKELVISDCRMDTDAALSTDSHVCLNGFQTWTESREFCLDETIPKLSTLARPIMGMYGDYSFYKASHDKLRSFTYTYIRGNNGIDFCGSLSESAGYTLFEYRKSKKTLRIMKDCAGLTVRDKYSAFDLFFTQGEEDGVFDRYFKASAVPAPRFQSCTGWTSWYNYYTKVTQKNVLDNLEAFRSRKIPIDIIQIDDGYQQAVGDWLLINEKFPDGMESLAEKIQSCGYKAGLWLAPLICEKKSQLCLSHPDWVVKKAGFNPGWSGFFYVLDFYNEEVREYLRQVFDTVLNKWNYDMVKLDFLYAASLLVRKDKTRGQIMYEFMQFLRQIAGDKMILSCGVPLGCAFGLTDACRVSSDVALKWEDNLLKKVHYRERVSTINALTSTVGRRHLNGRAFLNDPDVFILRSSNTLLTKDQKYTLFLLNCIFGGFVFTSDNINEYSGDEMALYLSSFALKERVIQKVTQDHLLNLYFTCGDSNFLVISSLSETKITQTADFTGKQLVTGFNVKNGGAIEMNPYQTRCFNITAGVE